MIVSKLHTQHRWLACVLACLASACSPTKYIPGEDYLLRSVNIEIDNKTIKKEQFKPYIRPKPNKKIIGMRFHLWLYNRSKPDKNNKWNAWLRKNGEEPVIWQQSMDARNAEQIKLFLKNKGYYHARVADTIVFHKQRADVTYRVHTGWPYIISSIRYDIPDTSVARLILGDTLRSPIKPGKLFDVDLLQNESKRIENHLKDNGYYSFAADNISYSADTVPGTKSVGLEMVIRPYTERMDNKVVEMPYPLYTVRSLTVNAQNPASGQDTSKTEDGTMRNSVRFIIPERFPVRPSTIRSSLYISSDSLYRISDVNQTYQHLLGLRNFQQVNIDFWEPAGQAGLPARDLDCRISLSPFMRQNHKEELEGTNSDGNLGGAVSFQYQNISLFNHAEIFDLRLRGMVEAVATLPDRAFEGIETKMEYEAEASLNIPKFLLPFRSNRFIKQYNPKTVFSILYNYQQYPEYYVRTVFNTSIGYNWRGSEVISHTVRPLDVNFVQLPFINDDFERRLEIYPYLKNSYQQHMVVSSSYGFVWDLRQAGRENSFFVRTNAEMAGLLLNTFFKVTGKPSTDAPYKIMGNAFSQFVKSDIDMRYYYTINGNNKLVGRIFAGVGWPYGNSATAGDGEASVASMPFEKKYYAGGANSIRGWRLRSLGPGSHRDTSSITAYPNNTGDIKLEANIEYRFKLIGRMDGALFMDAGNVWDTHKDKDREGADFSFDRFYREIALSGGTGLRFDLNYFILRADLGMKLHDPAGNGRWAFSPKPDGGKRVSREDFCLSIGIDYPF